jgi:hypothetical protein
MTTRRFPPPWRAENDIPGGYVVQDANGQALAYVHSRGALPSTLRGCRSCFGRASAPERVKRREPK